MICEREETLCFPVCSNPKYFNLYDLIIFYKCGEVCAGCCWLLLLAVCLRKRSLCDVQFFFLTTSAHDLFIFVLLLLPSYAVSIYCCYACRFFHKTFIKRFVHIVLGNYYIINVIVVY